MPALTVTDELLRATTVVGEHYYAAASSVGLTVQEARLLFILGLKPRNMLGLTSALRVPKSTMTGLMARMEAEGLLNREPLPDDRRQLLATPTKKGMDVAAAFARDLGSRVEAVLSPLSANERTELGELLVELLAQVEPTTAPAAAG